MREWLTNFLFEGIHLLLSLTKAILIFFIIVLSILYLASQLLKIIE